MIKLPKNIYNDMVSHAQSGLPLESCGYLAGSENIIQHFYPMTNIDRSPEHFSFDPKEQFFVLKEARSKGLNLVAVYHSHPESPARLSEEDIRLFNDPHMIYIIVSLMSGQTDVKAYQVIKPDEHTVHIKRVKLDIF